MGLLKGKDVRGCGEGMRIQWIAFDYKMAAYGALMESDPAKAAEIWRQMAGLCDSALSELPAFKQLILDYREAALTRYSENLQDAECLKNPPPAGLFPESK